MFINYNISTFELFPIEFNWTVIGSLFPSTSMQIWFESDKPDDLNVTGITGDNFVNAGTITKLSLFSNEIST